MVWQRSAKSPRFACAGSTPVASAKIFYGVAELERRESLKLVYVGSSPTSVANPGRVTSQGMMDEG